jgi:hypothetical protein
MTLHSARKAAYTVTAAALAVVLAACNTDAPTSPSFADSNTVFAATSAPSIAGTTTDLATLNVSVSAALRTKPLAKDVIASAVIDSKGGSIKVPGTGFELKVPRYAVMQKTTFQVKALAGAIVAYEFQPHGTRFLVPLTFSQETKAIVGGSAGLVPLLGYFSSPAQLNHGNGTAAVSEISPAFEITDISGKKLEGFIFHFSGYLVSSGRTAVRR